ncbi:MAG: class I SAM-dependent methyltransferase [Rhodospirillaceae bacterium]|nr:class I SAM-dependent methyltransferase [Rhodospirillaceae bacterium]
MSEALQDKHRIWDSYWADSRIQSAVAENPVAEAVIDAHWREFFAELPDGAHILDLGCGNGAVALIAARVSQEQGKNFQIHGIDAANIDPPKYVAKEAELLKTIAFKGLTLMEDLPFEQGQFDAVVSQFAMEFSDLNKSCAEVGRVMKRGAKFCALSLAANSRPVAQAAAKMRQSQFLAGNTKLFDVATAVAQALFNIENTPGQEGRDTKKYLEKFSQEVEKTMEKFKHGESETIEAVITGLQHVFVIRKTIGILEQVNMIALMKKRVATHVTRLEAMTRAALGDNAVVGFKRKLADAGVGSVQSAPFAAPEMGTIAWKLTATRT